MNNTEVAIACDSYQKCIQKGGLVVYEDGDSFKKVINIEIEDNILWIVMNVGLQLTVIENTIVLRNKNVQQ